MLASSSTQESAVQTPVQKYRRFRHSVFNPHNSLSVALAKGMKASVRLTSQAIFQEIHSLVLIQEEEAVQIAGDDLWTMAVTFQAVNVKCQHAEAFAFTHVMPSLVQCSYSQQNLSSCFVAQTRTKACAGFSRLLRAWMDSHHSHDSSPIICEPQIHNRRYHMPAHNGWKRG